MSVHDDPARARFVVRWREDGKHRTRRFADEAGPLRSTLVSTLVAAPHNAPVHLAPL